MSIIQDLVNQRRRGDVNTPAARAVPINLPFATDGLAGTFREPYRVNSALSSNFTPTDRQMSSPRPYSLPRR